MWFLMVFDPPLKTAHIYIYISWSVFPSGSSIRVNIDRDSRLKLHLSVYSEVFNIYIGFLNTWDF